MRKLAIGVLSIGILLSLIGMPSGSSPFDH